MSRGKKELTEQIIPKLREVEVEVGRGKTVAESVKQIGVTERFVRGRLRRQRKSGSTHPKIGQPSAHLNYPATLNSFRSCLKVIDTFRRPGVAGAIW